jgi:outer membrane protein assembly factor BamB
VFVVRQTGGAPFSGPPVGAPNDAPVFALDLATGAQIWRRDLPYNPGETTTWLLGHSNGRVYAARSGNGASASGRVHAFDAATGATAWISTAVISAGPDDGCVFADNGDLIVASFLNIWRIRATDGTTVWTANRAASTSDVCGAARFGDAVYVADSVAGGQVIKRFDLATGVFQYQSPVMPGQSPFMPGPLNQQHPMVGPDGTVYLNRAWQTAGADFFYAFLDTGVSLVQRWAVPSATGIGGEFGCGADGSVYMLQPGEIVTRLDAQSGAVLNTYPVPLGSNGYAPRFAVDADGRVYLGNGGFPNGALLAFERDLTLRWQVPVPNINIGGPVIAADGTLVVAGVGNDLRAYRTPSPWTNLGGGIAGALGQPALTGLGTLTAGNTVTFRAGNAPPNSLGVFILGASALNVPVFGGTLVPSLDVTLVAAFDAQGQWSLGLPWPAGVATGASFWWQLAVLDNTGPAGLTASAGLRSVAP